jgi:hypothetical protein
LHFGEPKLVTIPHGGRNRIYVEGTYHLWVEHAEWEIWECGQVLAHSESDRATISSSLYSAMDSRVLIGASVLDDRGACSLIFEHEAELRIRRYCAGWQDDDVLWHLFGPAQIFSWEASGRFSIEVRGPIGRPSGD